MASNKAYILAAKALKASHHAVAVVVVSMGCRPVGRLRATRSLSKETQGRVTHFGISLSLFSGGGYPLGGWAVIVAFLSDRVSEGIVYDDGAQYFLREFV